MYSYYTVNTLWLSSHSEHFQPRFGWALEINPRQVQAQRIGTVGWWFRNPGSTHQLILVVYLIIDRVLYIQNGEVGRVLYIPGGWELDFWTVNSKSLFVGEFPVLQKHIHGTMSTWLSVV